ncbi:MAG: hypothetical protein AAFN92_03435 [Bacteroidota bacterium]
MKNVLLTFLTALFATATAMASIDPYDLIVRADVTNGSFVVRTTTTVPATATIEILTAAGTTVYNGTLPAGHYLNKRFPLASLQLGTYKLVFTDSLGQTVQPLLVTKKNIRQDPTKARRQLFPRVKLQDDRLLVVRYRSNTDHRVNIEVANRAGQTVFADRVDGPAIKRAYQLDKLAAGDYYVTVSSRNVKRHTTAIALH